jgi:patatin-like phospholipase/acyl hydrolase
MKTVRILSIDGGGIRGILPLIVLKNLERLLSGERLHKLFDLVTGTSIGAFVACGVAGPVPLSADFMLDLMLREKSKIFPPDAIRYFTSVIANSKYEDEPLEELLRKTFGDSRLSESVTRLMVPAFEIEKQEAEFFKSWKALGQGIAPNEYPAMFDYELRQVVRASSAAPTYFPPALIHSTAGISGAYIDGAIVANNPAMCALASARKLYPDADRFVILSLGTGNHDEPLYYKNAKTFGLLNWPRPIINCLMNAAGDVVRYQLQEAPDVVQYRIEFDITGANPDIDDASDKNVRDLIIIGEEESRKNAGLLSSLPPMLRV